MKYIIIKREGGNHIERIQEIQTKTIQARDNILKTRGYNNLTPVVDVF